MERLLKKQFLAFYLVAFVVGFFVGIMTMTAHSAPTPSPVPAPTATAAPIATVGGVCRGVYVQPIHALHWWQKMEIYYAFYMQGRAYCLVGPCDDCTPLDFADPVKP